MGLELARPTPLALTDDFTSAYTPEALARDRQYEIDSSTQIGRGWTSAGLGEDANGLSAQANEAYRLGDTQRAMALEQQAQDLQVQAQQWAPTVQNMTDITGLRSGMDWAAGALGGMRTSVQPALGGLAGAALGGLAGLATRNAGLGARVGGYLGSTLAGYGSEYDEAVAGAMNDPTIRANKSYDEMHQTAQLKGVANSMLEGIVPGMVGGSIVAGAGKKLARGELLKAAGKEVGKDMLTEGMTEGAQSLVGQAAQNSLLDKSLTDFDYKQALNEAAAGAVAGGGMGVVGAAGQMAHAGMDTVGDGAVKVKDKAASIKDDPLGAAIDLGLGAVEKAATLKTRAEMYLENRDKLKSGMTQDEIDRETLNEIMGHRQSSAADPAGVDEAHLSDSELVASRKERAAQEGWDGNGSWLDHSRKVKQERDEKAVVDDADDFLRTIEGGSKKSMMRSTSDETRKAAMTEGRDAAESVKQASAKANSVAQVLVNLGYSEKTIETAKSTNARDQDVRKMAGVLNWGSQYGFNRVDEVVPAMIKQFGGSASKLFRKAYEAGVREGLFQRNDEHAEMIEEKLVKGHASDKMLGDVLVANLRPTVRAELDSRGKPGSREYAKAVSGLIAEVRRVVNKGAKGNELRQSGNVKSRSTGMRNVNEDQIMSMLFGSDEKTVSAVVEAFYKPEQARQNGGRQTDVVREVDEQDAVAGQEDESGLNKQERTLASKTSDHFKGDNNFFDLSNADDKAAFQKLKASKESKDSGGKDGDSVRRDGATLGIIDHAIEQAEKERGKELSQSSRDKIVRDMVHKLDPTIERLKGIPRHVTGVTRRDYDERKAKYDKVIERAARRLNAQHVALRVSETEMEKPALEFTDADIAALELNRDLRTTSVAQGTIVFQKAGADGKARVKPFITSAPMLLARMFKTQNLEQFVNLENGGSAYSAHDLFLDAIGSMLERKELFTGKFGFVKNGGIVWLDGHKDFPGNLLMLNGNEKKNKQPRFYGEMKATGESLRAVLKAWDGDPDDIVQYAGAEEGQVGEGTLADETPLKQLPNRDERGMPDIKDATVVGASFTGRKVDVTAEKTEAGPVPARDTPDRTTGYVPSWTAPMDSDVHVAAVKKEAADGGKVVGLDAKQLEVVNRGIKSNPVVRKLIEHGYVSHMAVDEALTGNTMGYVTVVEILKKDISGKDAVESHQVIALSPKLFAGTDIRKVARIVAHEVAHTFQAFVELTDFGATSDAARAARTIDQSHPVGNFLKYPLTGFNPASTTFEKELHAQLFALYTASPESLKDASPELFNFMEGLYGKQGSHVLPLTATVGRDGSTGTVGDTVAGKKERLVEGNSAEVRGVEQSDRDTRAKGVGGELPAKRKNAILRQLKTIVPVSDEHKAAITHLKAVLEGSKEGHIPAALDRVFTASNYLGAVKERASLQATKREENEFSEYEGFSEEDRAAYEADDPGFDESDTQREAAPVESSAADELRAQIAANGGKNALWAKVATKAVESNNEGQIKGALAAAKKQFGDLKQSKQKASDTAASKDDEQAARDHIFKVLGAKIEVEFADAFADGSSGSWTPKDTQNVISIALNGDVMSTAFHESFHEFMDILEKHGGGKTLSQIERVAMTPMMQAKLDRLLEGHPEAQAQLKKPDEATAFMYQFWMAGKLALGPETKTAFQKFTSMIAKVLGLVSKEIKAMELDELQTEKLLRALSSGAMADTTSRQAVVDALNSSVEAHEAAQGKVGKAQQLLNDTAGKLLFSAEAMIEATGNKYMASGSEKFHQKAGTAMKGQSFMDATRQKTGFYMNKLENMLSKYDPADLELARHGMSVEKRPTSKLAGEAYDAMDAYFKEMAEYLGKMEVKRLDTRNGQPVWVNIDFRKHYWPQVWDMDVLEKNVDSFRADLLANHKDVLANIAKEANAEVKRRKGAGENTASSTQLEAGTNEVITPEMIADSIIVRLQHSNGQIDINEDMDELGITPMAAAVNRRKLDWLEAEVFDKYKQKDVAKLMTTYTVNMVKRAEYQHRFGPAGEILREVSDKAVLFELAGDTLVRKAERELPAAVAAWKKAAAAWHEEHGEEPFPVAFPTLRSVGMTQHRADVGAEKAQADSKAALQKLEQGFKAFQAMEGTLGRDIAPNFRQFSSWMVTYQNFTKLSTMLFTSFQDVMGIVANGGEMNDAWNAFVSGIKEIKNSWTGKKDAGLMMSRAELWGAVDAGSFADAIGQTYGSSFMSGSARRMSDKFFKYTGAEGWNRGVRGVASQVAERTILEWAKHGIDKSDPAAQARVERLFGKGFDTKDIKLDDDGNVDITDPANQAAVTRWVLDAVPTTSAAHRPIWGSDPHYQMFIQFKNYTYSFHRILLKGAVEQAKLGNYRPSLVLACGYMPIAIAGGAIKEMLIPGEEPPWMQGGLDDYLSYGFSKAGVLGVPQMYAQNLYDLDPAATFGPTIDQMQNIMSIPLFENRTVAGEGLGALPGGNLLRRLAQ